MNCISHLQRARHALRMGVRKALRASFELPGACGFRIYSAPTGRVASGRAARFVRASGEYGEQAWVGGFRHSKKLGRMETFHQSDGDAMATTDLPEHHKVCRPRGFSTELHGLACAVTRYNPALSLNATANQLNQNQSIEPK